MTPEAFGRALVESGDLDPIYLMLNAGTQDPDITVRWCLGYWMFYHAGVASAIAESPDFWATVRQAQADKWPRGTERRHFKAENSRKSIEYLQERFPVPEDAVAFLASYASWEDMVDDAPPSGQTFADVANRAKSWVGFGPWIAFKIADMLDCVVGVPVEFPQDASVFFDDPLKGGVWAYGAWLDPERIDVDTLNGFWDKLTPEEARWTVSQHVIPRLLKDFARVKGPDGRGVRVQEVETILCKYKSHLNGHYPLGKDTQEIRHALEGWGRLASSLRASLDSLCASSL